MEINFRVGYCEIYSKNLYKAIIDKAAIIEKDHVIKSFKGDHHEGKSHKDIKYVHFQNTATVNYFPRGIFKHFSNLTHLRVNGGIKEISKKDLEGLEGLEALFLQNCNIISLPDDLFSKMPNLQIVGLDGNKIVFAS